MPDYTPTSRSGARPGVTWATPQLLLAGSRPGGVGARGVNLPGGCDMNTFGASKDTTEGSPSAPSLVLKYPSAWRFRWAVAAGARTISVKVKQPKNLAGYPSLAIIANSEVGLASDVVSTSAGGAGWVTVGPASFTASAAGVVWVELRNNLLRNDAPAYFDHLVVT